MLEALNKPGSADFLLTAITHAGIHNLPKDAGAVILTRADRAMPGTSRR